MTRVAEAMDRLAAADPARGVGDVPVPAFEADRGADLDVAAPTLLRGRAPRILVPVVAVCSLVAVLVFVLVGALQPHEDQPAGLSSTHPSTTHPATTQSTVAGPSVPTNEQQARDLVQNLARAVSLPAGAKQTTSAPASALAQPFSSSASDNLVTSTRFAVTNLGPAAAEQYFTSHSRLHASGSGTRGNIGGPVTVRVVTFSSSDTSYATEVQVQVEIVAYRSGSAVRIDAQAIWVPENTVGSLRAPKTLAVSVDGSTHPRHLSGQDLDRVLRAVNAAPATSSEVSTCFGVNGRSFAFDLVAPSGTAHVTVSGGGCTPMIVRIDKSVSYFEGQEVVVALKKALKV